MSEPKYEKQDVQEGLEDLLAQGFGTLTVQVHEHKIATVELLIRKRKAARATGHQ